MPNETPETPETPAEGAAPPTPTPPPEPTPHPESNASQIDSDDVLLKDIAADLKKEVNTTIDLSFLPVREQIKTLRAMKAAQTPATPTPPKPKPKNESETSPVSPDVPKFEYKSICETNKRGSEFDIKLRNLRAVGSNALNNLFKK